MAPRLAKDRKWYHLDPQGPGLEEGALRTAGLLEGPQ